MGLLQEYVVVWLGRIVREFIFDCDHLAGYNFVGLRLIEDGSGDDAGSSKGGVLMVLVMAWLARAIQNTPNYLNLATC